MGIPSLCISAIVSGSAYLVKNFNIRLIYHACRFGKASQIDWDTPDNNENFKSAHSIQSNLIYKAYTMGLHFLTHQKHKDSHQLKPYLL